MTDRGPGESVVGKGRRQLMCSKHFYDVVELSAIKNMCGMWQLRRMQLPLLRCKLVSLLTSLSFSVGLAQINS